MEPTVQKEGTAGAVIASIIIVVVLIAAGVYFWNQKVSQITQNQAAQSTSTDPVINNLKTQSDTDTTASIEADLNASDLNGLDQGVDY